MPTRLYSIISVISLVLWRLFTGKFWKFAEKHYVKDARVRIERSVNDWISTPLMKGRNWERIERFFLH